MLTVATISAILRQESRRAAREVRDMVHSAIVGIAAALFLTIRLSSPDTPLALGPSGITGWLIFSCQLAAWLFLALQRATYYHGLLTRKDPVNRSSSATARLIELSITGTFGLLLWATMFAPWMFFGPLLLLHWWLLQRRATMTLHRYGLAPVPTDGGRPEQNKWADGTSIDTREVAQLGILQASGAALPVLVVGWVIASTLSSVSPAAQGVGVCIVTALMAVLVALQYGLLKTADDAG